MPSLGEMPAANETLIIRRAIREDIYPSRDLSYESLSSHIDPSREYLIYVITFLQFIRRMCFPYHSMRLIINKSVHFLGAAEVTNARHILRIH